MAKIDDIVTMFPNLEFEKDGYGRIISVKLPPNYEVVSKRVNHGLLQKLEFRDEKGVTYTFGS